jgi:hypothetical protein
LPALQFLSPHRKIFPMKNSLLLLGAAALISLQSNAQCITMTCPLSVTTNVDAATCGATVNFATPTASSTCVVTATSDTFQYTGASQTFVVPSGIFVVTIETWGAQGGANWVNNVNYGGYVKGDLAVTPGETLYIYVGGQSTSLTGGYNGGGNGDGAGKGGGGGTDVRQGGTALANRIIVAGGGGGAGYWSNLHVVGGVGGGLTGGNGYRDPSYAANPGGKGGTQTGGGADGTCVNLNVTSMAGGFGYGGTPAGYGCGCEGYGGGGGWYGGAGSGNCRGGGGGSGYIIPAATNTSMASGVRAGNGKVVISTAGSSTPVVTQTAGLPSGSVFPVGTTTNTFTASDAYGNTNSCSFTITVNDNEFPVLSAMPSSISMSNDAGVCGALVSWNTPTATDNCSANLTSSHNSGDFFPVGTTTVTYTATDPSGNTDVQSFSVTVTDNESPVIAGAPMTVTQGNDMGQCSAVVTWPAITVNDNCGATMTSNYNSGDIFPLGTTTVYYAAIDAAGNTDTVSFTVTVTDDELPVVMCPVDISAGADAGMCSASGISLGTASATDNCSVTSLTNDAPVIFPVGITIVNWTAVDAGGNTVVCTQQVTVTDGEAPLFNSCPADVTMCEGILVFPPPTAIDNCSIESLVQTTGPASGSSLGAGNYTIIFAATDSTGNTANCSFQVTVNAAPSVALSLSTPAVVCFDDGNYSLNGGTPAGGTWSGNGVTGSSFDPSAAGNGMQAVTYTFTDVNGCTAFATDTITVSPCTGLNENGVVVFSMFPNPAHESFWFTSEANGTLEIVDVTGKVVYTTNVNSRRQEINTVMLAAGTYVVRYTTVGGVSTGRLILQ